MYVCAFICSNSQAQLNIFGGSPKLKIGGTCIKMISGMKGI